jgi:hypothetical protein
MKRTKTITIESRQIQIIRRRTNEPQLSAWCVACAAPVEWLSPEETARLTGQTTRALYRGIEAGEVHFCETSEGGLLLCLPSLSLTDHPNLPAAEKVPLL